MLSLSTNGSMKTLCNNCKHIIDQHAEECPYCHQMSYAIVEDFEDEEINFEEDIKRPIDRLLSNIL